MTITCCKCKRVRVRNVWKRSTQAPGSPASYTYCPRCLIEARAELLVDLTRYHAPTSVAVPVFQSGLDDAR